jgi:hypothetical protein
MIKITKAKYKSDYKIDLYFSDEKHGVYDFARLVAKAGPMVQPLRDPDYFKGFFLELGALCWKNGLELAPAALHQELADKDLLRDSHKAA